MKVRLVSADPHPYSKRLNELLADWWGKEIEVGRQQAPRFRPRCHAVSVYPIHGPQEFIDLLAKYDLGRFVCAHQIAEEKQCGEIAELHARTNG